MIKKHLVAGSICYTDQAGAYTTGFGHRSHLAELGYYHFWVNHSHQYVERRFPFVYTGTIETTWNYMKKTGHDSFRGPVRTTQISVDAFSMVKMIKMDRLVDFIYRALKVKFLDMQQEMKESTGWDDINFVNFHTEYDQKFTLKKRMKDSLIGN